MIAAQNAAQKRKPIGVLLVHGSAGQLDAVGGEGFWHHPDFAQAPRSIAWLEAQITSRNYASAGSNLRETHHDLRRRGHRADAIAYWLLRRPAARLKLVNSERPRSCLRSCWQPRLKSCGADLRRRPTFVMPLTTPHIGRRGVAEVVIAATLCGAWALGDRRVALLAPRASSPVLDRRDANYL